jgi:integrase/recombinase XerD
MLFRYVIAYTTHHRHQTIITALFNFAISQGYLNAHPDAKLQRRKPNLEKGKSNIDQIIRYLTTAQFDLLYQLVKPDISTYAKLITYSVPKLSRTFLR